jgi:hypothetical protein
VVTVCDSAAADCPTWPGAKHLVHWSIEDPTFSPGSDQRRLDAFRATRDELRKRIDSLMEVLRRSHPRRSDAEILDEGSKLVDDVLRPHGFRFEGVREARYGARTFATGRFARRGRAVELQARTGVGVALYKAGEHQLLHPDYMERLGVAGQMRFPGLSNDPLNVFRRLRADLVRFAGPFLTGEGIKEFAKLAGKKA